MIEIFSKNQPNLRKLNQTENFLFRWEMIKLYSNFETRSRSRFGDLYTFAVRMEFALLLAKGMDKF